MLPRSKGRLLPPRKQEMPKLTPAGEWTSPPIAGPVPALLAELPAELLVQ